MIDAMKKLQEHIENCDSQIAELQRRINNLSVEKAAYLKALEVLREAPRTAFRPSNDVPGRALSDHWRRVLAFIAEQGDRGAFIDEIERFIHSQQLDINRNSIRSQLSLYFTRGFLARIANSRYAITPSGRTAARLASNQESFFEAKKPSPPSYELDLQSSLPTANQSHRHGRSIDDDEGFH